MKIRHIGERRVFYMVVDAGDGVQTEVPIDEVTYRALALIHNGNGVDGMIRPPNSSPPAATTEQRASMADLMEQLDHSDTTPAEPLPEVPADLKEKLKSLGFGGDEPADPGEVFGSADVADGAEGDQL